MGKVLFLSVIALSAVAFADGKEHIWQARRYGAEAKIIVSVVHEDGSSVAGAEITGSKRHFRPHVGVMCLFRSKKPVIIPLVRSFFSIRANPLASKTGVGNRGDATARLF